MYIERRFHCRINETIDFDRMDKTPRLVRSDGFSRIALEIFLGIEWYLPSKWSKKEDSTLICPRVCLCIECSDLALGGSSWKIPSVY